MLMYPEDRVLVAYVPQPADFDIIRGEGWYRIPQRFAPKGIHAEYLAFYFGSKFGGEKWAIHYYAPRVGHELVRRFRDATEINDLFIEGGPYVDRLYATLKERGIYAERNYHVDEQAADHVVALSVPTRDGRVDVPFGDLPASDKALLALAEALVQEVARQGGLAHWHEPPHSLKGSG